MNNKKSYKEKKSAASQANEPQAVYRNAKIKIFHSFEEQEEYELQKMALLTREELLNKLEKMRKIFLKKYLLPNGSWPPISRIITMQPHLSHEQCK